MFDILTARAVVLGCCHFHMETPVSKLSIFTFYIHLTLDYDW